MHMGEMCSVHGGHFYCHQCFFDMVKHQSEPDPGQPPKNPDGEIKCEMGCDAVFRSHVIAKAATPNVREKYITGMRGAIEQTVQPGHVAPVIEMDPLEKEIHIIAEQIMTLRCPACQKAYCDFDACAAITCNFCGAHFCGVCFKENPNWSKDDAHQHVVECRTYKTERRQNGCTCDGGLFVGSNHWKDMMRRRKMARLVARLDLIPQPLKQRVRNSIRHFFAELGERDGPPLHLCSNFGGGW